MATHGAGVSKIAKEAVAEYDAACWARLTVWQATRQCVSLLKRLDSEA